jgi:hypothetical protein
MLLYRCRRRRGVAMRRPPARGGPNARNPATRSVVSAAGSRSQRHREAARSRRCAWMASTAPTASRARVRRTRACTRRPCRSTDNRRRGRDANRATHGKRPRRDRCNARAMRAIWPPARAFRYASHAPTTASRRPSRSSRPAAAPARRRACARPASAQCVADRAGSWYKARSRPRMLRGGRGRRKAARTAACNVRPDPPPDARSR